MPQTMMLQVHGEPGEAFTADPEVSFTLPGSYYFDPKVYDDELSAIMYRNWIYAGHVSALSNPGDYLVRDIGDQSVIILRDRSDQIVAFHNVCQHRAHRLLEGEGTIGSRIACPYHHWTYGLDGALVGIPKEKKAVGLDKSMFCLQTVRVEVFLGFVFFNIDPDAQPMQKQLGRMVEQFNSFCRTPADLKLAYSKDYEINANWKTVIENYSECYHCPASHPSLIQGALNMDEYRVQVEDGFHHHNAAGQGENLGYTIDDTSSPRSDEFGGWYMFPLTAFEFYPGGKLTVFHNLPLGPEKTLQRIEWYLQDERPKSEEQELIEFIDVVRREDFSLVESVQRGLHSKGYRQGRFVVDKDRTYMSEHAVHDFQHQVLRALSGEED